MRGYYMTAINISGETLVAHGRWTSICGVVSFWCPYCGARSRHDGVPAWTVLDDRQHRLVMVHSFECQTKFVILDDKDMWFAARSVACKITVPEEDVI